MSERASAPGSLRPVLIGLISDVHCNAEALDWALADLESRVDEILLAGDAVYEYRFSNEVVAAAKRLDMPYVLGNHEIVLLGPHGARARSNPAIIPENLAYMASRPTRIDLERGGKRICMVHASPWAPYDQYVYSTTPLLQDAAGLDDVDVPAASSRASQPWASLPSPASWPDGPAPANSSR
jgi:predicted phosphodiesterase